VELQTSGEPAAAGDGLRRQRDGGPAAHLWIVRTGSPWRDLPEAFGDWNSVFRRFSRWSIKGVWYRMFEAMSDDPDFEYLIIDSTIVRAHQHAAGAKKGGLKIKRSAARAAA
jgi:transposase